VPPSVVSTRSDSCAQNLGVLPEALLNFVALLGWTPPEGREVLSLQAMVDTVRQTPLPLCASLLADA
jgi:glutamyl/glutaminyl-tRNA synthetase